MTFGHHPALLLGVEERRHRRHVERGLDTVFFEQVKDPRHADPIAELAPGQTADRVAAVAQVAGLVVTIERQRHRATGAARPLGGPKPAPGTYAIDEFSPLFFGPLPGFEVGRGSVHAFILFILASIGGEPAEARGEWSER